MTSNMSSRMAPVRFGWFSPRPFRALQGWRYLAARDAPRDLDRAAPGAANMPEYLRRELRVLGLL
jgi:hypothetical protein